MDFFTGRHERVEWKTYSYDAPADLTDRLTSAGFVAEGPETLLLGEVGGLIHDVDLPPGVRVRAVTEDADLTRIDELMRTIWGPDRGDGSLAREMRANPDALDVVVVLSVLVAAGSETPSVAPGLRRRTAPARGATEKSAAVPVTA